ncbi:TIGR02679 family protein [Catenulispora pinisilvae]|uniref:TIGR02679 family protein n=1 Tax=Catenulispora pinisilvae TaxID=2705253 RepID=UPI0018926727|nr:TIGR02679 family protein [Catenulispora pinisilvae]
MPPPDLDTAFPRHKWDWLRTAVRAELERRPDATAVTVAASGLSDDQRATIKWLLKLDAPPQQDIRVSLARLDRALTEKTDAGLPTRILLEALDGELDDIPRFKQADKQSRLDVWANIGAHPAVATAPALQQWLEQERLRRALPADPHVRALLLQDALTVLQTLPAQPRIALTVLAATTLGSAHALDEGPLPGLILRGLAARTGGPLPENREQERALWNTFGIVPDELSSRVLVHGLRPEGSGALAQILRIAADAGTPCVITLQQLDRHQDQAGGQLTSAGQPVWICENVAVIWSAAEALGSACPPIICVEGWPSAAAVRLVNHVAAGGSEMRYHGDFDKSGLEITNYLTTLGAVPWRMAADDYNAAVAVRPRLSAMDGDQLTCQWDRDLPAAMRTVARQLEEEHVIAVLVEDLANTRG